MDQMPLGLSQGIVTLHARAKVSYHWRKARWHGSNAPGFIPGDCYLHARAKVSYHWRKARWHGSNAPGFTPGDRYLHAKENPAMPQDLPARHQINLLQTAQTSRLDAGGQSAYFSQKSRSGINMRQDVIFRGLRTWMFKNPQPADSVS